MKADVWAQHIAGMGEMRRKQKGRDPLQDLGVDGKILKLIKLKRV
jgi:hypothetical protein